ncbi:MAG: response regulator [Coleofasciculus sp. A1-SPW-01]|uniref:response regulator n=1 Tax=Coleofasciculus sp. A1-SPW-01 TaxID=3070819 RepID=UPI003302BC44
MKTVLIVEDEPINFRVFSKILTRRSGLNVKGTEDVEEAMKIAQAGDADIILMDACLAHSVYQGKPVDGIKMAQMLKADAQASNLPIIFVMPGNAMEGDCEALLKETGADGYIKKPIVDPQQFVDQILALLPKDN